MQRTYRLEVDGETFEVAEGDPEWPGANYAWISGPNPGYGFSSSSAPATEEAAREAVRLSLEMIDPMTGYIEA